MNKKAMRLNYFFLIIILYYSCNPDNNKGVTVVEKIDIEGINTENEETLDTAIQIVDTFKSKEIVESETIIESRKSIVSKNVVTQQPQKKRKPKTKEALKKKRKSYASFSWQSKEFNFGEITEGDIVEHSFKFINNSKTPLEIKSVTPSCGCTLPSYPFLSIEPGASNEITVTYNSVSKDGDQLASITIVANTNPATTVLNLKGTVSPKEKVDSLDATIPTIKQAKEGEKGKRIMKDKNTKIGVGVDNG